MSKYYSRGILKSSVCPCGPYRTFVYYLQVYVRWSPMYIRTKNRSLRLLTLAYIHSRELGSGFWFLRDLRLVRLPLWAWILVEPSFVKTSLTALCRKYFNKNDCFHRGITT
jgi:hypothetical protein